MTFDKQRQCGPEHIMHLADIARPGVVFEDPEDFGADVDHSIRTRKIIKDFPGKQDPVLPFLQAGQGEQESVETIIEILAEGSGCY